MATRDHKTWLAEARSLHTSVGVFHADLGDQIALVESVVAIMETPLPPDPRVWRGDTTTGAPSGRQTGPSHKSRKSRRSARQHRAVVALTAADLKPYRACKDFVDLGLTYARLHGGVVTMRQVVALAVKLRLTKAKYHDAWSNVYRRYTKHSAFVKSGPGEFTVDPSHFGMGGQAA